MKKTLFLFTNSFPYGNGEQYLNDEFILLEQKFTNIFVLPINVIGEKRIGFESVEVVNLNNELKISKTSMVYNFFQYLTLIKHEGVSLSLNNLKSIHHAWSASEFILDFILRNKIDFHNVTVYSYWFFHSALIAGFSKKRVPLIKAVSRAHMGDVYDEIIPMKFPTLKLKYLDSVITISDHARNYLTDKFPDFTEKVFCSRLGVLDRGINPTINDHSCFTIVTCSSVTKRKRIEEIAEAIGQLKNNIKWVHFGDGNQMQSLKSKVKLFPNNIKVILMGWVPNNDVLEFYKKNTINLFINLSFQEGIPVSIMEAISFGVPILAFDVYGLKEIVNDVNGVLLPVDSKSSDIAMSISKILNVSYSKEEIKRNWKENYFAPKNYSSFIKNYIT
jgi:glycosyltransferase involved in cell wall biosynthesis